MNNTKNNFFSKVFWFTLIIKQNEHHKFGVLIHTLKVVWGAIKDKNFKYMVPALLHDIGKPIVAFQKPEDVEKKEYSFTDHEEASYQVIKNWRLISDWTKNIVRYHYIIRDMDKCLKKGDTERLKRLTLKWDFFNPVFKEELIKFLKYDDYGKK